MYTRNTFSDFYMGVLHYNIEKKHSLVVSINTSKYIHLEYINLMYYVSLLMWILEIK